MKSKEIVYLSIYFAVRKDKKWSKTERVKYLIDTILFMLCSSLLFIILGIMNLRDFKTTIVLIFITLIATSLGSKIMLGKGKEQEYIQSGKDYDLKRKRILAIWGVLFFVLTFIILILSAIFMSYLWSIDLPSSI